MNKDQTRNYKWVIILLGALTNAVCLAIPSTALSMLLPEISKDLDLNLIQAGLVWSIGSLPSLVTGLIAGSLYDRFGPKRILIVTCVLIGLAGASRGLAHDFTTLMITVFLFGFFVPLISLGSFKNAVIWFSPGELAFANGLASLGMAAGFMVGSLISAAYLSPALGGWRNVFFLFGAISFLFMIPWFFTRPSPGIPPLTLPGSSSPPFLKGMLRLMKLKDVWFLGLAALAFSGGIQGVLGYLPLYLQDLGWSVSSTASVLSSFHVASMICVLPLTFWSDRLGSRKMFLFVAALLSAVAVSLICFVNRDALWGAVVLAGLVRDGFMAVMFTFVTEIRGIESKNTGLATGFMMFFINLGCLVAPPLGNSLAMGTMAGTPLLFWAGLILFGGLCILLTSQHRGD